jgi:class 3 adenylate cyclase
MIAGFLREYIDIAIEIIHSHQGIIDKVIGDGILAIFGHNSNNDNTNGAIDGIMLPWICERFSAFSR